MNTNRRHTIITVSLFSVFLVLSGVLVISSVTSNNTEELLLVPFLGGIFMFIRSLLQDDGKDELL